MKSSSSRSQQVRQPARSAEDSQSAISSSSSSSSSSSALQRPSLAQLDQPSSQEGFSRPQQKHKQPKPKPKLKQLQSPSRLVSPNVVGTTCTCKPNVFGLILGFTSLSEPLEAAQSRVCPFRTRRWPLTRQEAATAAADQRCCVIMVVPGDDDDATQTFAKPHRFSPSQFKPPPPQSHPPHPHLLHPSQTA